MFIVCLHGQHSVLSLLGGSICFRSLFSLPFTAHWLGLIGGPFLQPCFIYFFLHKQNISQGCRRVSAARRMHSLLSTTHVNLCQQLNHERLCLTVLRGRSRWSREKRHIGRCRVTFPLSPQHETYFGSLDIQTAISQPGAAPHHPPPLAARRVNGGDELV